MLPSVSLPLTEYAVTFPDSLAREVVVDERRLEFVPRFDVGLVFSLVDLVLNGRNLLPELITCVVVDQFGQFVEILELVVRRVLRVAVVPLDGVDLIGDSLVFFWTSNLGDPTSPYSARPGKTRYVEGLATCWTITTVDAAESLG
ncbi:hypothetical protein [Halomicrobium salinisoli]|uniref:hypothetical protein n=1 Tax=Halomicrobium salinisoli TaxID=2878391 RepID=UPI001CF03481|nr:hypothetical protein [Halomicrobium salinisoli]